MVISRVIIRVTPFRALITLLITYLLSPLPLQVRWGFGFGGSDFGVRGAAWFGTRAKDIPGFLCQTNPPYALLNPPKHPLKNMPLNPKPVAPAKTTLTTKQLTWSGPRRTTRGPGVGDENIRALR